MHRPLERQLGDLLRKEGQTLSIAESCTGGLVCDRITDVPGSSDYFKGGVVSYSIEAKARHLHISLDFIKTHGVVSSQVAKRMARGVQEAFQTTYGVSTTGVAGPTGGTEKTPVGTVFIGFSDGKKTVAIEEHFKGSRREIKKKAAERALQLLYEQLSTIADCELQIAEWRGPNGECGIRNAEWVKELTDCKESTIVLIRKAPKGISTGKGRLGIFPASFNPPTMAHLALIREAGEAGHLDEVLILLDIQAMDKAPIEARFEDRLEMVKRAFQKDPRISIGLSNHGLFLAKLKPLRELYPTAVEFVFIVGFDTIVRVMDRKYYRNRDRELDRLFKECRFLIANRGDQEREAFLRLFQTRENRKYRNKISFFALSPRLSTLSSTQVRERVGQGQPIGKRVPASTLKFIREKGLYQASLGRP